MIKILSPDEIPPWSESKAAVRRNSLPMAGNREHPVAELDWPIWAKALKILSKPRDKGIGDVVKRTIGDEKSEAFKEWFQKIFKRTCGCDGRLAQWNSLYPLT